MRIIGLFPLTGNGGIASWTKKFIATFPDDDYQFSFINVSPSKDRSGEDGETMLYRMISGLSAMHNVLISLRHLLKVGDYDILHTTTSGNLGAYRDYRVARLCRRYGVKTIMHCRFGCITEDINSKGLIGMLLRKAMRNFDQIWVLDTRSFNTLKSISYLKDKVFLTPNCIEVAENIDLKPKSYTRVSFVGNLVPSKGIYELVEACIKSEVRLDIIGPGSEAVISHIKEIARNQLDQSIFIHGRLPNNEAVKFINSVDIVALPTYYASEAFPISILEAMSLTKMVISCPRAAIKDMLTGIDGNPCGLLVEPKSVRSIVDAILWCKQNPKDADLMCRKAYEKVNTKYSQDVIFDLYRLNYNKLLVR